MAESEVYNRDILANPDDEEILRERYPEIADWLPWTELKEAFLEVEGIAAAEKGKSHRFGKYAIWCAFVSTAIIAVSPVVSLFSESLFPETSVGKVVTPTLHYLWAPFLIASAIFGRHSLHGDRRARWLEARSQGERLRQLFFQHLACWLPYLVSKDPDDRATALKARTAALAQLSEHYGPDGGAIVHRIVNDLDHRSWALVEAPQRAPAGQADPRLTACLLRYIRDRRLAYQQRHAARQVDSNSDRRSRSLFARWSAQRSAIAGFGVAFVVFQLLIGILYILLDLFAGDPGVQSPISLNSIVVYMQMFATLCAAFVVALKALEDGMQYHKDIMRYRTYAGIIARISVEVDRLVVEPETDFDHLRAFLLVMEELSYWEMREFLTLHLDSRFSA